MECPRCEATYLERTYMGAIASERCPTCYGHFFARGDLAAFLKSPTVGYFAEHMAALPIPSVRVKGAAVCPKCEVTLRRSRPAQLNQAAVDVCPRCGGTWLDGIEIQRVLVKQVKEKGPIQWILDTIEFIVSMAWNPKGR